MYLANIHKKVFRTSEFLSSKTLSPFNDFSPLKYWRVNKRYLCSIGSGVEHHSSSSQLALSITSFLTFSLHHDISPLPQFHFKSPPPFLSLPLLPFFLPSSLFTIIFLPCVIFYPCIIYTSLFLFKAFLFLYFPFSFLSFHSKLHLLSIDLLLSPS